MYAEQPRSSLPGRLHEQVFRRQAWPDEPLVLSVCEEAHEVGAVGRQAVTPGIASEQCQLVLKVVATPGQARPVGVVVVAVGDLAGAGEGGHECFGDPGMLAQDRLLEG